MNHDGVTHTHCCCCPNYSAQRLAEIRVQIRIINRNILDAQDRCNRERLTRRNISGYREAAEYLAEQRAQRVKLRIEVMELESK